MDTEERIYQRIGEFAVTFQWLENRLREIGWFILDPEGEEWPSRSLRNLPNQKLIDEVHALFIDALRQCELPKELEEELKQSFDWYAQELHKIRRARNRILHSAFIELKASGEVKGLVQSDPRLGIDEETGEPLFDQEYLTPDSFDKDDEKNGRSGVFSRPSVHSATAPVPEWWRLTMRSRTTRLGGARLNANVRRWRGNQ